MTELDSVRLSCHAVQHLICEIWSGYFGREVSPYDDFFDLGGDSLAMIDVVVAARGYGLPLRSSVALRNPSPARLAESLTVGAASVVEVPALLADSPIVAAEPRVEAVTGGVCVSRSARVCRADRSCSLSASPKVSPGRSVSAVVNAGLHSRREMR